MYKIFSVETLFSIVLFFRFVANINKKKAIFVKEFIN